MSATIPAPNPPQPAKATAPSAIQLAPPAAPAVAPQPAVSADPAAAPQPQPMTSGGETPDQALARAQAAAQAKRLNEASGICADVLAAVPDHPAALALQGIIAAMAGDPEQGVVLLRKAISLRPGNATWYAH